MRRNFTRLAALATMLGAFGMNANLSATNLSPTTQEAKNTKQEAKPGVVTERRITKIRQRSFIPPAGRFLNQRQYRKSCRHNASSFKSKKHRSKN